jgi:hypothetical protein
MPGYTDRISYAYSYFTFKTDNDGTLMPEHRQLISSYESQNDMDSGDMFFARILNH